jgi:hypothetical protein
MSSKIRVAEEIRGSRGELSRFVSNCGNRWRPGDTSTVLLSEFCLLVLIESC